MKRVPVIRIDDPKRLAELKSDVESLEMNMEAGNRLAVAKRLVKVLGPLGIPYTGGDEKIIKESESPERG